MSKIDAIVEGLKNLQEGTKTLKEANELALATIMNAAEGANTDEEKKMLNDISMSTQKILTLAKSGDMNGITQIQNSLLAKYGNYKPKAEGNAG